MNGSAIRHKNRSVCRPHHHDQQQRRRRGAGPVRGLRDGLRVCGEIWPPVDRHRPITTRCEARQGSLANRVQAVLRAAPPDGHSPPDRPRAAPELSDAQASTLREAGRALRGLSRDVSLSEFHGGSQDPTKQGWIGPPRQLAAALRGLQQRERGPWPRCSNCYASGTRCVASIVRRGIR